MILGMLLLTMYPICPEINLPFFAVSIIYIGSIKTLDKYKLEGVGEEVKEEERGFLENLLS